jgi:hypothetical protein
VLPTPYTPGLLETGNRTLVIGNSAYLHTTPLPNPVNDAALLAAAFTSIGFAVDSRADLDTARLRAELAAFFAGSSPDKVNVLYYAGHAIQVNGENYLVPVDFRITPDALSGIRDQLVPLSEIVRLAETSGARRTVLILDACRDNPFAEDDPASGLVARAGLAEPGVIRSNSAEILFLYATAPGQVAFDGSGTNSPFAEALAAWVRRPGLSLADTVLAVRRDVSARTDAKQVPWSSDNFSTTVYLGPPRQAPDTLIPDEVARLAGQGRLVLAPSIAVWIDALLEQSRSAAAGRRDADLRFIAVSRDGERAHSSHCQGPQLARCDEPALADAALQGCRRRTGLECGLYAVIRNGVLSQIWLGEVQRMAGLQVPVALEWEGIGSVPALIDYSSDGYGRATFLLPGFQTTCTASYRLTDPSSGTFEGVCTDGLNLRGTLRRQPALDYLVEGEDSLGRRFTGRFFYRI